jgi:glycosyltransferase involved in cell wall biosynthesis
MAGLSVIIITKNEAHNIRACLESVKWAEEIIVVDSGSTDSTLAICREFTPHVYLHDWPGFGQQKNRALGYASKDWVLSLDADERVTPELCAEIQATMSHGQAAGYDIPRLSSFCGRYMRHSGWYPDYVTRLFLRNSGSFSNDLVHERVVINGTTGRLKHALLHESFRDLDQLLAKMNHYSSAGAEMLGKNGRDATLSQAIFHGLWAFIRTYLIRAGFLDGREGFMLAVSTAEATYYRYAKRLLRQQLSNVRVINIVEPTLMTEAGHCHSFVSALVAAGAADRPFRLWINRKAEIALNYGQVEIRKYFYRSIRRFQSYFLYRRLLKMEGKVFIATAGRTDLLMLQWAARGIIPPGKVYLYFHWFNPDANKIRSLKKIAVQQPNLEILGPTSSVVTAFKEAGFTNASVVPYPITPRKIAETNQQKTFTHLLYAGAARQDKGFGKVVDLVEYLYRNKSQIPVIIQTSSEHFGKCDTATLADIKRLQSIPYVFLTLKTDVLSASEYENLFAGAIVLQLYNTTDFSDRVSGVTLDALSGGCPVITNHGTWIARLVENFEAGKIVEESSSENILKAIIIVKDEYLKFNNNAIKAGEILQQENSAKNLYGVLTEND